MVSVQLPIVEIYEFLNALLPPRIHSQRLLDALGGNPAYAHPTRDP